MAQIKEPSCNMLAVFQKVIRYFHEKVKRNHQDIDSLTEMFEDEFNMLYNLKKSLQDCLSRQSGKNPAKTEDHLVEIAPTKPMADHTAMTVNHEVKFFPQDQDFHMSNLFDQMCSFSRKAYAATELAGEDSDWFVKAMLNMHSNFNYELAHIYPDNGSGNN